MCQSNFTNSFTYLKHRDRYIKAFDNTGRADMRILATILTFIDDPKWVNDFALTKLLEYYYNKCKELKNK